MARWWPRPPTRTTRRTNLGNARRRHARPGWRRLRVLLLTLGLCAAPAAARAQASGYTLSDRGALTVEFVPASAAVAERVVSQFKAARAEVEANLGAPLPRVPHVVVAPTDEAFAKRFQAQAGHPPSKTILAVAFPGKALVIIRASGIREGTDAGLGRTLRHELGHLVLGEIERQRGKRLPRWLNEGLCEWAAGRRPTLHEKSQLSGWAKFFQLPRLEDLRETFPDHGNASARTYLVACGFLVYLDTKKSPRLLVEALARSSDVDAAFQATYGAPVDDLEAEWKLELADNHSILTSIATSFSAWSLAALLAILAGLRAYWKRRVLMRQLEQDDQRDEEAEQALAEIVRFPAPQENTDPPPDLDPPPGPTPKAPLG